jgi:hypothetical protein
VLGFLSGLVLLGLAVTVTLLSLLGVRLGLLSVVTLTAATNEDD